MKMKTIAAVLWLFPGLAWAALPVARAWTLYIEFLWEKSDSRLARLETLGFLLDGAHDHLVCVAAVGAGDRVEGLVIEAVDADGKVVGRQSHDEFTGEKHCYSANLDAAGAPGQWTFRVYSNGQDTPVGSRTVEVARTLQSAPFHAPSPQPYVLGRPNYDPSIPPEKFSGRLVWVMHVDADGKVTGVDIEVAEGVGVQMKERALAAGFMSLFPPDPSRGPEGITYRRELKFSPEQ